jgi:acyl-CoA thioesterase I
MSPHRKQRTSGAPPPPRSLGRYGVAAPLVNRGRAACRAGLLALVCLVLALAITPAAAATRVLAFGDSLTAGYGIPSDAAFPTRLADLLAKQGIAVRMVNGGVSGDTTADGLARLDWAMADHPEAVLLELGANDALRGIDPKLTYDNLDRILARLTASGAKVLLIGMLAPPNWGHEYQQEFDAIYPRLAAKYHVPLYPFILDGVALDPKLVQADGLHPNVAGAALIAEKLAPYVARLLQGKGSEG